MKKFTRTGKKALSVFLAALMVMTTWVFVAPKAEAVTAGKYKIAFVVYDNDNGCNGLSDLQVKYKYKANNGTGTESGEQTVPVNVSDAKKVVKTGGAYYIVNVDNVAGFPSYAYAYSKVGNWQYPEFRLKVLVAKAGTTNYTKGASGWTEVCDFQFHHKNALGSNTGSSSTTSFSNTPTASSLTLTGGSTTLEVPKSGSAANSSAAFVGTVYDQYGVVWWKAPKLTSNYTTKIDFPVSDNSGVIKATNAKSNAASNYDVTVTASYTGLTSQTKTCKIIVFDYNVTFKNHDGTVLSGPSSYDYGKTPAAPSTNPTRSPDANNHYTFNGGWSPTPGALTSGDQDKVYTAQYKAAAHNFVWKTDKEPTCTETGIKHEQCTVCGYRRSENTTVTKKNHTYGAAATCTTPQTCTVCGTQLNPALGHDFSSMTASDTYLKSAATCVNDAVYYYKCLRCTESSKNHDGTTWTKADTALGHKFSVKNTDAKYRKSGADCINAAEYYYKCERCDVSSKGITDTTFTDGVALGHSWDAGVVTKEQKCTETGIKKYTCSRCGTTREEVLPVLDHLWDSGTVTTSPTCEGAGVRTFVCQRDSSHTKTESISPNGHTWNTVYTTDKEPTCTEKGSESIHCAKCDAIQAGTSRDINPIGHDWGNWVTTVKEDCINAGSETRTCKRDSSHTETQERPALGHDYAKEFTVDVVPTCTEKGSKSRHCTRCDATTEVTEIPANGHKYSDWIVDTDSTCYSEGTQHRECTVCHVTLETKPVEKKNHTYPADWTITKAATCTEKGRKEKRCTVEKCKALLIEEEIPANGHTAGEWIIDKDSSCTATGEKHQICSVCGETIATAEVGKKDHTLYHEHKDATCTDNGYDRNRCSVCNGIFDEKILEKLGHDPKVVSDTQPTCYHDGLYKKVCARENCGVVLETQVRPKLGHIYGEGVKHDADCTKGEYVEYVCTRTGCSENEPGHIKTEVYSNMQALGHDWTQWTNDETKTPTCDTPGEQYRLCNRCHIKETREISKLGHDMQPEKTVEASCLSGAYTEYVCNNGCGFTYRIYDDSKPATDHTWVTTTSQEGNVLTVTCECSVCHKTHTKQVEVDEVHNYSVVSEVKAATCKEAGKIRITCDGAHKAGCTEFIEVETPVNANAHSYETTKVDATCKAEGYVLSKCSLCGNEIKTTLPTTAHAWDKGVETKPATCTETGVKTFTCSICGDTYTEVIAQTQHTYELINTVAPTCKDGGKSGYKVYKCSACDATYNEITSGAISHNWSDWEVVQKATDKLCGIEESTCSVCGEEQLRMTDPIGDHNFVEDTATKKAATCTEDGSVTMKCTAHTDCGVTYEKVLPKLGHDMAAGTPVAATCEHEGYTDYTCSRCSHSYRIVTEAKTAHTLETKTQEATCLDPSFTYTYCTKCNTLIGEVTVGQARGHEFTVEVSYKAPTNTENGEKVLKCSRCTETITVVIPAQGHEFELVSTEEATCAKTGLEIYKCKTHTGENDCGLSYTNVIPKKEHTYATRVKTPANCVNAGVGEFYCTACDKVFGEYDIAALGHNFTEEKESVPSTCSTVGYVTKQCSRCTETETTYSSTLGAHSWGELKTVQTADETHPGIKVKQCSVCKLYEYEYTAPTGNHTWDDGVVTTKATCTTEGEKTYTCKADGTCACKADSKATYTETIPATGHKAKVDVKEATCTEAGYVKAVCETCHAVLDEKTLEQKAHAEKVTIADPTCTTPGSKAYTCAVCGATTKPTEEIPVVPHAYEATGEIVEATCTSPKYEKYACKYCKAEQLVKVGEANGHDTTENYVEVEPATCTKAGYSEWRCHCGALLGTKVLGPSEHTWVEVTVDLGKECDGANVTYEKCSVCGAIKANSLVISESGDHEYVVTTETAATCTTEGKLVITCSHCNNVNATVTIPAIGHTYDDGVLTEGTCKTDGNVTFTCTREGCTDAQTGHTITKNIGTKNHNYKPSGDPVAATCTSSGYQLYKCEYCDKEFKEILEAPAQHKYEKQATSVEPNCYQGGHYVFKCKNCAATYEYDLPATGNHEFKSEVTQEQSCTNPEITTYTCTTDGCGYSYIKVTKSALGHSWGDWKVTKEPTDTENGEQERSCTRSGCDATETAPIPAKIHHWGETPIATTEATCTAAATETYQCEGCDLCNAESSYKTYVKTVGVPLQHNVVVDYTAATCTTPGSYVARCTLCGTVFVNETISATGHSFNTYLQDTYVPATCQEEGSVTYACSNSGCSETQVQKLPVNPNAHNMVEDPDNSKEATCTKAGYKAYKCANRGCDHKYMMQVENPVPHNAKDTWTVAKAATCSSDGYEVLECKDCGAIMDTRAIPATGNHTWETVTSDNAEPTCTEGSYSYNKCSDCGKLKENSFVSKDALGHKFSEFVKKKDATAKENGYVIYKCSNNGCEETIELVIPASGHDFTSEVTKKPTCTEKGVRTYTCTVEGHDDSYTEEIPALGHKAGDVEITPATCLAAGSAVVKCEVCNVELYNKTLAKLPHTFNDTKKVVVPATCQTIGSITYTCATEGCTATLVTTLEKTPHDYKLVRNVAPTCLDSGYDVYACSAEGCTASYNVVTKSANGHSYVEDTARTVQPTCSTVGHKYFKCSACNAEGYDYEVPATGKHTYNETVKVDPTCESAGYTYNKCTDCDAVDKDSVKAIDPLGHDYSVDEGNGVVKCSRCDSKITVEKVITDEDGTHAFEGKITKQSTCKEQGTIEYTCRTHKNCAKNHTEKLPLAEHSATAASIVKTDPVCKVDGSLVNGSIVVKCSVCGTQIGDTVVIPAAHKYTVVKVERATCGSKGKVTERCSVCGHEKVTELEMNASAHEFNSLPSIKVDPTCTTDGYEVYNCKHCDAQKFVKTGEKLNHQHTESVTKNATCTSEGYTRITCKDCGKIISETVIEKTAHVKMVVKVDATCTGQGSVTTKCSVCGKLLKETEYTPALGHKWGEWEVISGGNCKVEGKRQRKCTVCGETETISTGIGEHVYPEEGVVTPPTCTTDGFTTYTCTVCHNHSIIKDYTPKLGHKYSSDYRIVIEPTCHSTGSKAHYCVNCNAIEPEYNEAYVEIPKLAHTYGEWTVIVEPTCENTGIKERICVNEGCKAKDEGHVETAVVGRLGHHYGDWTVVKEPTCVENGTKQRICDRCNGVETEAVAMTRHTRVADPEVPATCVKTGLTAGSHCSVCGKVFVAQKEIPMISHMDLGGDGKCDTCGKVMTDKTGTDTCFCHGTGFRALVYRFVRLIWKLFKVNQYCTCGAKHW